MPTAEAAFIAKVREQVKFLQDEGVRLRPAGRMDISGIADPWVFGPADEFETAFHKTPFFLSCPDWPHEVGKQGC